MEGEVWEVLLAEVPEGVSLLGEGFEDWPQPASMTKRAREAARKAISFIALPYLNVLFPFMTSLFLCYQKVI